MLKENLTSVGDIIRVQWNSGAKALAKATEGVSLKENILESFSCSSAEILEKYITNDEETNILKKKVMRLQKEQDSVLICGPSGTGKELLSKALHGSRGCKEYGAFKFIAINCTTLPDQLLESELFGHKKGSFTGAVEDKVGKFEAAYKGTLFLDEIGDMPLNMQTKLLRVLQEKVMTPVGSNTEIEVKCRVVAATNKTEAELLESGKFREDLYWRLSGFILKTKPLSERLCDIEDIVDSLGGEKLVEEFEKYRLQQGFFQDKAALYTSFFNLKGNVRSLQSQVRKWLVFGER